MKDDFYEGPVDLGDTGLYFIAMDLIEEAMIVALPNGGRFALPREYSLADFCNEADLETMPLIVYANRIEVPSSREFALPVFYSEADAERAKTTFVNFVKEPDYGPDPCNWTVFGDVDLVNRLEWLECHREMISLVLLNPFGGSEEYVRCVHIDYLIELVNMEIDLCGRYGVAPE